LAEHGELVSTNDTALDSARAGDPGRLWITAASQTGGRGRNGRSWTSHPGNLFASFLLIDPAPPRRAPELGFVASIALAQALREVLGDGPAVKIKWPNDILGNGAKVAGILLESAPVAQGLACVAGIGVNCASHPDGPLLYKTNDLSAIAGRKVTPDMVLEPLAAFMAHWLGVWSQPAGFEAIRAEWLTFAAGQGEKIRVTRPKDVVEGVFKTIDATGRLLLQQDLNEIAIDAGDVFLLPPAQRPN
jgi:BirA family biotin operon repressor/biotin-[acetyl-CoA-carboxylase] ligase